MNRSVTQIVAHWSGNPKAMDGFELSTDLNLFQIEDEDFKLALFRSHILCTCINLLKPTGHVMHQQF